MAKTKAPARALSSPPPLPRGPHPLALLVHRAARPAFARRSAATAQIMADWPAILGPELAALAEPLRLARGTLTLGCTGPAAMELALLAPAVIERINGHLGRAAVQRLAFVQRAPRAVAPPPPPRPAPAAIPPATTAGLAGLPEGELRAALAKLAGEVYRNRG